MSSAAAGRPPRQPCQPGHAQESPSPSESERSSLDVENPVRASNDSFNKGFEDSARKGHNPCPRGNLSDSSTRGNPNVCWRPRVHQDQDSFWKQETGPANVNPDSITANVKAAQMQAKALEEGFMKEILAQLLVHQGSTDLAPSVQAAPLSPSLLASLGMGGTGFFGKEQLQSLVTAPEPLPLSIPVLGQTGTAGGTAFERKAGLGTRQVSGQAAGTATAAAALQSLRSAQVLDVAPPPAACAAGSLPPAGSLSSAPTPAPNLNLTGLTSLSQPWPSAPLLHPPVSTALPGSLVPSRPVSGLAMDSVPAELLNSGAQAYSGRGRGLGLGPLRALEASGGSTVEESLGAGRGGGRPLVHQPVEYHTASEAVLGDLPKWGIETGAGTELVGGRGMGGGAGTGAWGGLAGLEMHVSETEATIQRLMELEKMKKALLASGVPGLDTGPAMLDGRRGVVRGGGSSTQQQLVQETSLASIGFSSRRHRTEGGMAVGAVKAEELGTQRVEDPTNKTAKLAFTDRRLRRWHQMKGNTQLVEPWQVNPFLQYSPVVHHNPTAGIVPLRPGDSRPVDVKFVDSQFRKTVMQQLVRLAEAWCTRSKESAEDLSSLQALASPRGTVTQRLAFYFLAALSARFKGEAPPPVVPPRDGNMIEQAQQEMRQSWGSFTETALTWSLATALQGQERVHIILLTNASTPDWLLLFQMLSAANSCQGLSYPSVRITICVPYVGAAPLPALQMLFLALKDQVLSAGQASDVAVQCNLVFAAPADFHPELIPLDDKEAVGVASFLTLKTLPDQSLLRHNPRDGFIKWLASLSPAVFAMVELDADYNSPFFLPRFKESLEKVEGALEMLDSLEEAAGGCMNVSKDAGGSAIEQFVGMYIINCISCDGLGRYERAEPLQKWRDRMEAMGFVERPFDADTFSALRALLPVPSLSVQDDKGFATLCWKGRPIYFAGSWCMP